MITLYQYKRAMGLPNASPFCMKMETWLRLAGLEYKIKELLDPRKAPMAKLPMIEHDGNRIADSSSIIEYLTRACDVQLDSDLTAEQRAIATAYQRMLEEHSYWGIVYGRWVDPAVWAEVKEVWFGSFPPGIKQLVCRLANKQARRDAHGQGLSRHSKEEVMHRVGLDLDAVATQLGSKPYFLGDKPHGIDATVYAFVANLGTPELHWDFPKLVNRHANLPAYCARMRAEFFSDLILD